MLYREPFHAVDVPPLQFLNWKKYTWVAQIPVQVKCEKSGLSIGGCNWNHLFKWSSFPHWQPAVNYSLFFFWRKEVQPIKYKKERNSSFTQDVMCAKKIVWLVVILGMKNNFVGICRGFKSSKLSNIYSTYSYYKDEQTNGWNNNDSLFIAS